MNRFIKIFIWLLIFSTVGYFGYQAYTKWWNTDLLKSKTGNVEGTVASTTEKAKSFIQEQTAEIKEKAGEYTDQVVEGAKDGVLDFIKEKIGEGITSLGENVLNLGNNLSGTKVQANPVSTIVQNYYQGNSQSETNQIPAPTSSLYFQPPSVTSIIAQENSPLIFSINSNVSYHIDWGDGEKEEGSESDGNVRLLSHIWKSKGDYSVKITISNGSGVKDYSFPIRVY